MNSQRVYLFFILVALVLMSGIYWLRQHDKQRVAAQKVEVETKVEKEPVKNEAVAYDCQGGKTAFEILEEKYQIKFEESSFGKLVTSINNQPQGNGKYWLYSIDGQEATVGATAYNCLSEERIVWELK